MKRTYLVLALTICMIAVHSPNGFSQTKLAAEPQQPAPKSSNPETTQQPKSAPDKPTAKNTAKLDRRVEIIKGRLIGLGIASRVTIFLTNGNERYGSIERIDDTTFQLADVDTKQLITMTYVEVKKVREGYGNINQFNGKRWNPIWAKIAVVALGILFAVVIPLSVPRT